MTIMIHQHIGTNILQSKYSFEVSGAQQVLNFISQMARAPQGSFLAALLVELNLECMRSPKAWLFSALRVLSKGIYTAKEGSLLDRVEKLSDRIREKKSLIFILFSRIDIPIRFSMQRMIASLIGREVPIINCVFYMHGLKVPAGRHLFSMFHSGLSQAFILLRCLCLVSSL